MTCREFAEFLWRYIDRELPEEQRLHFDAHLSVCPHCVAYLDTYRRSIELTHEALLTSEETVPPEVPEELIQAVLAARKK